MAEVIRMPRMSDTMTEAVIVGWNKKVGDTVKPGDVLAEVETDKATMELESYNEGTLLYIGVEKGKSVLVDGVLAIIGKAGEDYKAVLEAAGTLNGKATESKAEPAEPKTEESAKIEAPAKVAEGKSTTEQRISLPEGAKEIRMPLLSDTMTEGKIVAWNKKLGDKVKADDTLAEVETDKATMEVVGYEEGTLLYIGVEAGKAAKINEIIAIVGKAGTDVSAYVAAEKAGTPTAVANPAGGSAESVVASAETLQEAVSENSDGRIKASPLAKKIASEKGIDISKVNGTGDGGRVTKRDIDEYKPAASVAVANTPTAVANPVGGSVKAAPVVATFTNTGEEGHTDVPLTQMRKVIARRLGESKFSAPHFYLTMEINMDNAMKARNAMNEVSPVKISFNDLVIKACATALRLHPDVNSSWMGDFIRQNHHIHIGSALALPEGLIVPVIKFADQKTLSQIAADAKQLYAKARDKKLQPPEFSGNTFTISNLGMMDIEEFTAIINPPDSCILAVGNIREVVIRRNGAFDVTNVMKVTLSCDHRSVDGAVGAAFLQTLKKYLENPVTMLV
ncbi:pyruvate dehydrogenase complex dihydrolipoamide acetyltransferase [soil metagenome]